MGKNQTGTIKEIKQLTESVYSVKIESLSLEAIDAGEYISIFCEGLTFRRPFSVADFSDNIITVLIKKRGKGTSYILSLKNGDKVEFSAPLGNTFKIENKKTLLIGAGIGVAPLFYLNKKLKSVGAETYLCAGFLTKSEILGDEIDFVSTDDGSNGNGGSICDYLGQLVKEFSPERIVTCAPYPVLKFVAEYCGENNIECEVCMEHVMACGIGVCRGCAIDVKRDGKIVHKTVCKDGPVFDGKEVVWG